MIQTANLGWKRAEILYNTGMFDLLSTWFPLIAVTGVSLLSVCTLAAALAYTGRSGEKYSLLNHYISELGEVGVSRFAWLFNAGMILGGICFLFFVLGLGLTLQSFWGWLGLVAGTVASLSCSLVGVFSMNHLQPHIWAAMTYFRSGLLTVLFFGIAILFQDSPARIHPMANLSGLVALASYASFLITSTIVYRRKKVAALVTEDLRQRPRVWPLAVLEWAIFLSTVFWFFSIAISIKNL